MSTIDLGDNGLVCDLPAALSLLDDTETLFLDGNEITGTLELSFLPKGIDSLYAQRNQFGTLAEVLSCFACSLFLLMLRLTSHGRLLFRRGNNSDNL